LRKIARVSAGISRSFRAAFPSSAIPCSSPRVSPRPGQQRILSRDGIKRPNNPRLASISSEQERNYWRSFNDLLYVDSEAFWCTKKDERFPLHFRARLRTVSSTWSGATSAFPIHPLRAPQLPDKPRAKRGLFCSYVNPITKQSASCRGKRERQSN